MALRESAGRLLVERGLSVSIMIDPYLRVDPGTMSPLQPGHVFTTDDGAAPDLVRGQPSFDACRPCTLTVRRQRNGQTAGRLAESAESPLPSSKCLRPALQRRGRSRHH
jgi:CTP synthase (UTP-ammonia lyase)